MAGCCVHSPGHASALRRDHLVQYTGLRSTTGGHARRLVRHDREAEGGRLVGGLDRGHSLSGDRSPRLSFRASSRYPTMQLHLGLGLSTPTVRDTLNREAARAGGTLIIDPAPWL